MTRLLHAHSGNLYGGVETLLLTLVDARAAAPALDMSFALSFADRFARELRAAGARVAMLGPVRTSRPWSVLRARRALRDLIERERPDAVVCHSPWSQVVFGPVARAAKVPLVFWAHGELRGAHWLERAARFVRPDAVICNSRFTQGSVAKLYPDATAHVLYCPVPAPAAAPEVRERVRAELGVAPDRVVILQVSRMEEGKGQAVLLDALAKLDAAGDWECWLVGAAQRDEERAYEAALRERTERLGLSGRVRFLGGQVDVPAVMTAADVYCQPNVLPEGFGITLVEALNAGLPVVTSDLGGAREIVNEECGMRLPAGDALALRDALEGLVRDAGRRAELGAAGPARGRALSDPAAQARRLEGILAHFTPRSR